ncbi:MAG: VCBS repeat-containing protein [Planctomycetes bacterium]|nr:VCBS repeat-containing protein [Planctomycetota bacterium]
MDLDRDGIPDIVSGSYSPGHLYVFRGLGAGKFAEATEIRDFKGRKIHAGRIDRRGEPIGIENLAASPHVVDWDGDGDLDLLVGNILGHVILIPGERRDGKEVFGPRRVRLEAAGELITVGDGDAGPTTADWDGDGRVDLIVGGGDGRVQLFRNVADAGPPVYAAGVDLVGPARDLWEPTLHDGERPVRPAARAKPCVVNYDGDGLLDLLVGDLQPMRQRERSLGPKELARLKEIEVELAEVEARINAYFRRLAEEKRDFDPEAADYVVLGDRQGRLLKERGDLRPGETLHGFVFFYKRLPTGR